MRGVLGALTIATLAACSAAEDLPLYAEPPRDQVAVPPGATVVSLTFDDGFETHKLAAEILERHGLRGTFYVVLSRLGREGNLTTEDLRVLADRGHEIGAHTFTHRNLAELPLDEAARELCDARIVLRELGFGAESFAYPFGALSPELERIASACQYNSARGVGGLYDAESCVDCPTGESVTPAKPYAIQTPPSIDAETSLDTIKQYIQDVEDAGGGWVPLVFHTVCDGCSTNAVSPAVLEELASWLATRGTIVATVDQVIPGEALDVIPGPVPVRTLEADQLLVNPSFEVWSDPTAAAPDCWRFGADNGEQWIRSEDPYDGSFAQQVIADGAPGTARILSGQDMGTCAISVSPGQRFQFTGRYRGSSPAVAVAYYRTRLGRWVTWENGGRIVATDDWSEISFRTPEVPDDATAISVGIALETPATGSFDDFRLTRRD